MPEEKSLQTTPKNRHRRRGRHMMGQTVPGTSSSNRKGPVAKGGQPCATDIQRQWGRGTEASPRPEISRVVYSSSSARYGGAVPCRHLYTRTASLNSIRSGARSQCSWWRSGDMWSYLDEELTDFGACTSVYTQQWPPSVTQQMSTGSCGISLDLYSVSKEFQSHSVLGKNEYLHTSEGALRQRLRPFDWSMLGFSDCDQEVARNYRMSISNICGLTYI